MGDKITLYEEFRLIERSENEVNIVWKGKTDPSFIYQIICPPTWNIKTVLDPRILHPIGGGAHLLLFFMAFVFGSFCTFCFHMLMYLFEEKCVLFPKLLSLTSLRHNVIYEFIPEDKDRADMLPVDFLSTQWVEKSACYLPTYVPVVSAIFGLVWTTMFLMCSTGSRTLTGLQRPWRVVPPVFVFSLAMGGLCIYSSTMTHRGLQELCIKLGEITGSSTCSYTVNVATLAYERRIRGVYQATQLTIISAWLHTSCWLLSALLALMRILLAVDFKLVRVSVDLRGDLDKMLEDREEHLRTVSPDHGMNIESNSDMSYSLSQSSTEIHFQNKHFETADCLADDIANLSGQSDILFFAHEQPLQETSELSLVPEECNKLTRLLAYQSVPKEKQFIVRMLYDLLDTMELPESPAESPPLSASTSSELMLAREPTAAIARQYGQETISPRSPRTPVHDSDSTQPFESVNLQEAEKVAKEIKRHLQERVYRKLIELPINLDVSSPSTSKKKGHIAFESSMNITSEMKRTLEDNLRRGLEDQHLHQEPKKYKKKSNLKNIGVQTEKQKQEAKQTKHKVTISESKSTYIASEPSSSDSQESKESKDKDTQTQPKEKQD